MLKRKPTKQKILNILKKDANSTIKEIMEHFSISEIAVRRHIRDLVQQGFIKENKIKQEIGRPYYTYELTDKGHETFPNQYEQLPVELLQDLEAVQGRQAVKEVLDKRKEREETFYLSEIEQVDHFDDQISTISRLQSEKGYMTEYEKLDNGDYIIKNYNCPILNLASSYGRVCRNEKEVFAKIFPNSKVISEKCMTKGEHYCKWVITRPKSERK